jgi:hypothetical protein
LRVRVYAGHDKLLHKPLYLKETISAGPDEYCDKKKWGRKTRDTNTGYYRKHITPFLGRYKINNGYLDGDLIDEFYAELERCRDHCTGSREPCATRWTAPNPHRGLARRSAAGSSSSWPPSLTVFRPRYRVPAP